MNQIQTNQSIFPTIATRRESLKALSKELSEELGTLSSPYSSKHIDDMSLEDLITHVNYSSPDFLTFSRLSIQQEALNSTQILNSNSPKEDVDRVLVFTLKRLKDLKEIKTNLFAVLRRATSFRNNSPGDASYLERIKKLENKVTELIETTDRYISNLEEYSSLKEDARSLRAEYRLFYKTEDDLKIEAGIELHKKNKEAWDAAKYELTKRKDNSLPDINQQSSLDDKSKLELLYWALAMNKLPSIGKIDKDNLTYEALQPAIKDFQLTAGLRNDGYIGPQTNQKLINSIPIEARSHSMNALALKYNIESDSGFTVSLTLRGPSETNRLINLNLNKNNKATIDRQTIKDLETKIGRALIPKDGEIKLNNDDLKKLKDRLAGRLTYPQTFA